MLTRCLDTALHHHRRRLRLRLLQRPPRRRRRGRGLKSLGRVSLCLLARFGQAGQNALLRGTSCWPSLHVQMPSLATARSCLGGPTDGCSCIPSPAAPRPNPPSNFKNTKKQKNGPWLDRIVLISSSSRCQLGWEVGLLGGIVWWMLTDLTLLQQMPQPLQLHPQVLPNYGR